jgi:hypothetical protein
MQNLQKMKQIITKIGYLMYPALCMITAQNTSAQNIGIGTGSPVSNVHINGSNLTNSIKLTNVNSGVGASDGMDFSLTYDGVNVDNRFGRVWLFENIPFRIGTNNTERLRITNAGNVGVGVTDPTFKLEMDGSLRFRGGFRRIYWRSADNLSELASFGIFNNDVLSIADHPSGVQTSKFFFNVATGQFGIGANPAGSDGELVVSMNSFAQAPQVTLRETELGDYSRLEFANTGAERTWHIAGQTVAGAGSTNRTNDILNIWNSSRGDIMTFRGDGRVGILTTTPANGYALSVNGKIICNELRVQLTGAWPDYVFDEAYTLSPLKDVANFIKTNKHLPGIPKAEDIARDGQHVGDIQKKMMEKIEELTLYLIEHQKQLEEQQAEIAELKKHIANINHK